MGHVADFVSQPRKVDPNLTYEPGKEQNIIRDTLIVNVQRSSEVQYINILSSSSMKLVLVTSANEKNAAANNFLHENTRFQDSDSWLYMKPHDIDSAKDEEKK